MDSFLNRAANPPFVQEDGVVSCASDDGSPGRSFFHQTSAPGALFTTNKNFGCFGFDSSSNGAQTNSSNTTSLSKFNIKLSHDPSTAVINESDDMGQADDEDRLYQDLYYEPPHKRMRTAPGSNSTLNRNSLVEIESGSGTAKTLIRSATSAGSQWGRKLIQSAASSIRSGSKTVFGQVFKSDEVTVDSHINNSSDDVTVDSHINNSSKTFSPGPSSQIGDLDMGCNSNSTTTNLNCNSPIESTTEAATPSSTKESNSSSAANTSNLVVNDGVETDRLARLCSRNAAFERKFFGLY